MKTIVTFIALILSFTFLSCDKEKAHLAHSDQVRQLAHAKLQKFYNSLDDMFELKKDTVQYIIIQKDDNLWNISKQYLGTGRRHMDIAMFNYGTYREPSRWYTSGPNPHYDYASAYKGETLYLPLDAVGPGIKTIITERYVLKEGKDLNDLKNPINEILKLIKVKEEVVKEQQSSGPSLYWLIPFLVLLLVILLCCFLQSRTVASSRRENNDNTERINHSINEINRALNEIKKNMDQSDSKHLAVEVIEAANKGGGTNQGYSYLRLKDDKNNFDLEYENRKDKVNYTMHDLYTYISQEFPEYEEDDLHAIVTVIYKNFQEYDVKKILSYLKNREVEKRKKDNNN